MPHDKARLRLLWLLCIKVAFVEKGRCLAHSYDLNNMVFDTWFSISDGSKSMLSFAPLQIPDMLGVVLSSSKYGVRQARGKYGMGAKMALIWSKKSTGLPIQVLAGVPRPCFV